jgi:hypothetical protein
VINYARGAKWRLRFFINDTAQHGNSVTIRAYRLSGEAAGLSTPSLHVKPTSNRI